MSKQTAGVDAVSGPTYTSVSHEASLQSALDTLGFSAADRVDGEHGTSAFQ